MGLETDFDIRVYFEIFKRRFFVLCVPFFVVLAAVVAVAFSLPPTYRATAVVLVESPQISDALARSTATISAGQQLQVLRQKLTTRDRLLLIANEHTIGGSDQEERSTERVVKAMREATRIEPLTRGAKTGRGTEILSFQVSFDDADPEVAARVANDFVDDILELNLRSRSARASQTVRFFEGQLDQLRQSLDGVEQRIATFKAEHSSELPDSIEYRQTLRTRLEQDVQSIDQKVLRISNEYALAQREAGGAPSLKDQAIIAERMRRLEEKLLELRTIYTEQHPKVQTAKAQLNTLLNRQNSLRVMVDAAPGNIEIADSSYSHADPAAARSLALLEGELSTLAQAKSEALQKIEDITISIAATPSVERELNKLQRERSALETQFLGVEAKLLAAATGEQIEANGQGERFEVIESASVPDSPIGPNRRKIIFVGVLLAAAVGVSLVILAEMMDQTIHSRLDLERQLNVRALAVIPHIPTRADAHRSRMVILGGLTVAIVSAGASLMAIHLFYLPLPLVIDHLLGRLS